jgi:hypothetical protein
MRNEHGRRKRSLVARNWLPILIAGVIAIGAASSAQAQNLEAQELRIRSELAPLGKRGEVIAHARELVLQILEAKNGCSQWFEEAHEQPAEVFRSLHYQVEDNGPTYVYGMADQNRELWFKEPWAASTSQGTGPNSTIRLNGHGPFFSGASRIMYLNTTGYLERLGGSFHLTVGSYSGNSDKAQVLALLHELGHIVERLPVDTDSWDGRSSQNSVEVLRHCKREIRDVVKSAALQ